MERRDRFSAVLRNLAWSIIPITLPLLVLGFSAVYVADSYMHKEIAELTTKQLDYLRDSLDLILYELDALNITLSSNKSVISSVDNLFGLKRMDLSDIATARLVSDSFNAQINARTYIDSVYFYLDKYPDRFLSTMDGIVQASSFVDTAWMGTYGSMPRDKTIFSEVRPIPRAMPGQEKDKLLTLYRRIYPISGSQRTGVIVMNMRESFFDRLLERAVLFKGQRILILDEGGGVILGVGAPPLDAEALRAATAVSLDLAAGGNRATHRSLLLSGQQYVYESRTERYGWRIVTLIPASSFKRMPSTIRNLIIAVLCGTLALGTLLAAAVTRRRTRRLEAVVDLFKKADLGEELPAHPEEGHDEYDYMVQTLIRTFLKQRYATLQLSERQAKAELLELQALKTQLNPHFLFNTMDALYWMLYGDSGVPSPAAKAIEDLAALLRYSLESGDFVPLEREVAATQRYLAIHRLRHGEGLQTSWSIAAGIGSCLVPKLILQPIVENCIQHAFRKGDGRSSIFVAVCPLDEGRDLEISVRDDGPGMDETSLAQALAALASDELPTEHIGLQNTNRRIRLLYGPPYGLSLRSSSLGGTTVAIQLPFRSASDASTG